MVQVSLFGEFALQQNNGEPIKLTVRNAQLLLAFLLVNGSKPRDAIFHALWPDELEDVAEHRLRQAIYSLRKTLEPKGVERGTYLVVEQRMVGVNPNSNLWCDAVAFQHNVEAAFRRQGEEKAQLQEQAVALYRGEFLEKGYDDWCIEHRLFCRNKYLEALEQLIEFHIQEQALDAALSYALQSIAYNPRQEHIHHHLIYLHYVNGDRAGALAHYRECERVLKEDDLEPLPETTALFEQIQSHSAAQTLKHVATQADVALGRAHVLDCPFVGRADELATFMAAFGELNSGSGQTLVISGEAGVGKTRLAQEMLLHADAHDALIFRGRCYEIEGKLPYQPFIESIRECVSQISEADFKRLPVQAVGRVANLVPEMFERLPRSEKQTLLPEPDQERNRLFEGVVSFFEALSQRQPILLFVDDLQWADDATLQLLAYLIRQLQHKSVLILGAYREEEVHDQHPLWDILQHLIKENRLIHKPIASLNAPQVQAMVCGALESEHMEALAESVYQVSKGFPFYVEEMLKSFVEAGVLSQDENERWTLATDMLGTDYISPNISALVGTRLRRLNQKSRDVLELIAVLGRALSLELLTRLLGRWHANVYEPLETLIRGKFLEEHDERYRFHHDLMRQVIYQSLPKERRRLTHLKVAEALETIFSEENENTANEFLGDLAAHFYEATRWRKALKYALQAGHFVWTKRYAKQDALRFYERAQTLAEKLNDQQALIDAYKGLSEVCCFSDEQEKGLEYCEKALELCTEPEDRAEVYCAIASVHHNQREMETGLEFCEKALEELGPEHESPVVVKVLFYASNFLNWLSQPDKTIDYCTRGLSVLEQFPDDNYKARLLAQLGNAHSRQGNYESAIEHLTSSLKLAEKTSDLNSINQTNFNIALAHYNNGAFEQAKKHWENSLQITQEIGYLHREFAAICNWLATVCMAQKELEQAFIYAEKQLESNEKARQISGVACSYGMLGCLYDAIGVPSNAEEMFAQALDLAHDDSRTYQAIILAYLKLDDAKKALIWLERGSKYLENRHLKHLDSCAAFTRSFDTFRNHSSFKSLFQKI